MNSFVRAVKAVSQLCGFIAAGLIALGVLVVCHMVFVRYALGQTPSGRPTSPRIA